MYNDLITPYQVSDLPAMHLGGILVDNQLVADAQANIVLKSLNRHGLIAGATGTGKTKTIQVLCEQLSLAGVPSLVMDIKGDVSGLAMSGEVSESIISRCNSLNVTFIPRASPVEFLTLSESQPGVVVRSTVSDFGPVLFSRMLGLNETQEGVVTVLFQYAKEARLPLVDLADMKSVLKYVQTAEGKENIESNFGRVSSSSVGAIVRNLIELESQGGDELFGEPAFDVSDLVRVNSQGLGIISILRLLDMQDKPKLFSTFMLKLLSDVYRQMPELGDPDKPKLVLFIDEAHLLFSNATKALLNSLDTMVKLIRSKGIGLIFCTQTPNDIPESVLSQLGLKVQHALRAFTAKDRKNLKLVAQNFPPSDYYNTEHLLTSLGIGEALVCALDGKGQPTPLIQCRLRPPESRMGILTAPELSHMIATSSLCSKYSKRQNRISAKTILEEQILIKNETKLNAEKKETIEPSLVHTITKNTLFRQVVRQVVRDLMRSILSVLGVKKR